MPAQTPETPDHPGAAKASAHPATGVVIPAHRPDSRLVTSVVSLRRSLDAVVVVLDEKDPDATSLAVLAECREAGARVVELGVNRGIGAALNAGIEVLRSSVEDLGHVLTLDQDSVVPDGYVEALLEAQRHAVAHGVRVAMVAPESVDSVARLRAGRRRRDGVVIGDEPIQSGLLVPVSTLDDLGTFDETLFIDGVDTDFYLRARTAGRHCVLAIGTRLEHRLGRAITVAGGRELPFPVSADFRYHYQCRNTLLLLRRHATRHPVWAVRAVGKLARHLVIVTVLAPGRQRRLGHVRRGLAAGLRGRSGPI
ncbi:glycosyltransferase [Nocardioides sp. 616]|uniref:glycosyltransferase n=1 Tax=Nocardioides sp. 616 TaxID=2268090 RepID=UPI000CE37ACA|nr:glycosyltransferase [Nocardioides sp. 616]